jgi:hypothetical protein
MSKMFRCPSCKEVIRTGQPVCQYCDSSIDAPTAQAEALKFQAGIDACAAANHIKSLNYAAPVLLLLDAALLFLWADDEFFSSTRMRIGVSLLPFGSLAGAFGWFTKYGGLRPDDPDFPEAKQTVKKALILWMIMSVIHIIVIIVLTKTF